VQPRDRGGSGSGGGGGGRGCDRGGGSGGKSMGHGGAKGGSEVVIEPHKHEGIFIAKRKESILVAKNLVPDSPTSPRNARDEYRSIPTARMAQRSRTRCEIHSKASWVLVCWGTDKILTVFLPARKDIGGVSGTTINHVADIVGAMCLSWGMILFISADASPFSFQEGVIHTVEFSAQRGCKKISQ